MVTHHPIAIAELGKEQVQVMWNDEDGQVHAHEPAESPRGMGYAGILTSDMFGLRTTLDNKTERLLRLRRRFVEKETLTEIQRGRLKKIDDAIERLGFTTSHWDKEYEEYLQARKQYEQESEIDEVVSPKDLGMRKQVAQEIVQRLHEKQKSSGTAE